MRNAPSNRIMMISTHGYVAAQPELGKPDTGGQVVYVLELSKCLARMGYHVDILTRRFENQPFIERVDDCTRLVRFPCGGNRFIAKEFLGRAIPEWSENVARWIQLERHNYKFISSHYWDAGLAGDTLARALESAGARCTRVDVYRTVPAPPVEPRRPLSALHVDNVVLASPSAVTGFVHVVDVDVAAGIYTIGPSTTAAARRAGLTVTAEAREPSFEGILEAMQWQN